MPPLALSDEELDQVMRAAAPLPRDCRDGFLQDVAQQLQSYNGELGSDLVHRIVMQVQRQHWDPPQFRGPAMSKYR